MYGQYPKAFINLVLGIFCLGIVVGDAVPECGGYLPVIWGLVVLLLVVTMVLLYRSSSRTWLALLVAVFLLGMGRYWLAAALPENSIGRLEWQNITLTGIIADSPRAYVDEQGKLHLRYVVECEWAEGNEGRRKVAGKAVVYANENSLDLSAMGLVYPEVTEDGNVVKAKNSWLAEAFLGRVGDAIRLSGTVRQIRDYGNPGRMNRTMSYGAQDVRAQLMADKYSLEIDRQEGSRLSRLAEAVHQMYRQRMEQVMPSQDAAAIFAMLFGGYQGIKPELLEAFTATGIVHILSVSGSHITLMAGMAGLLGNILHLPEKAATGLAVATICFYVLLAGLIPPVLRSAIMGLLTLLALSTGRERDAQHVLGLTALLFLLYSPLYLYDISFQLSCGATAGLLYISPALRGWLRAKLPRLIADSMAVTIGAQLSVLPVLAWYFNTISLSSLLANLIITPVVELIIVVGLLAGMVAALLPFVGSLIFMAASLTLGLVYELSRQVAALPGSQVYLPSFSLPAACLYYLILGLAVLPGETWRQKVRTCLSRPKAILSCGTLLLFIILLGWHVFSPKELQVHFIDVGQGDAALVITPHGRAFMVDTGGTREGGYDIGKMVDVPYLRHYGVQRLDYIFLTHAHEDHAAGVKGILGQMPVGAIMTGHEGAEVYLKVFGTGNEGRDAAKLLVPLAENTAMEVDGVKVEILYSPRQGETIRVGNATGNEFSNLIRVSYGAASFLLTGDLVQEQEAVLLERGTALRSTVLKVGHHGSRTSSSQEFLQAVQPRWAVISCGYANSFGHPHGEVLERLAECTKAKVFRTDLQGAIMFTTDGEKIKIHCYRDDGFL